MSRTVRDTAPAEPSPPLSGPGVEGWFRRGNRCAADRDHPQAIDCYLRAIALAPEAAEIRFNLGTVFLELKRWDEAAACFQRAVALAPDFADAHLNLGIALYELKSVAEAIAAYRRASELAPGRPDALYNLGLAHQEAGDHAEAIGCYRRALEARPDFVEALVNLGHALQETGNTEAASTAWTRALTFGPDCADAHYNLGRLHQLQHRFPEAIRCYGEALRYRPVHAKACNNTGKAYQDLGQVGSAVAWYRRALEIEPGYAEARFNLATAQLLNGEFQEGWTNYEARWVKPDWQRFYPRRLPGPCWDGSPLDGRTILVHSEQGLGDMLQFARYLPLVKACGGRVVFETRAALIDLFRGWDCLDDVVPITPPEAELDLRYDVHVPLLSLPRLFHTGLGSIPRRVPYVGADPQRVASWASRISGDGLRVGLVWAGTVTDPRRATPLAWFAPWSSIPGVQLFGLQKGPAADLLEREGPPPGMTIVNLGPHLEDFADTASAIAHIDLVVSIDTSVAHLAGAMGKPVYLLLPQPADWRWLVRRTDSPWYPTMRLMRQETPGDWAAPMTQAARAIDTLARGLALARSAPEGDGLAAAAAHFHKRGATVEATLFYQRLLREHPDHPEGLHGLGLLAYQAQNPERAIELIGRAAALAPAVDRYHYHLGLALAAMQRHDAAEQAFSTAHALNPSWEDARVNRDRVRRRIASRR